MRILVVGDIHFPFHHARSLKEVLYVAKSEKPTHVVQVGDLYDQYSFSRFTRKNLLLPEEELSLARKEAVNFWRQIRKFSPRSKNYQILGNHDVRLIKRTEERMPEAQTLIREKMMEIYEFEGVKTLPDDRDILKIGDISFHHGYLSRAGDHMRNLGRSIVVGHSHIGGLVVEQRNGKTLFELNAGHLADETQEPLRYRPTKTSKWSLGYGFIDKKGPRFVSL